MGRTEPGSDKDWLLLLAIAEKRLVVFVYENHPRIGEPHDYGFLAGSDKLNFRQLAGESGTGTLGWKTLEVGKIGRLAVLDQGFAGTVETPSGRHLKWDEVYASVTPSLIAS